MSVDLTIQPACVEWPQLIARRPAGAISGRPLDEWRTQMRRELGMATDRPIIATGHQPGLWHPGILAKYLAADAFAAAHGLAAANLVVDQDVDGFPALEIPVRRNEGGLEVRRLELGQSAPRRDVPMGRHAPMVPRPAPADLTGSMPWVVEGVRRIAEAMKAHASAPNAALQMAAALADLMQKVTGIPPMPIVTATDLMQTSLGLALRRAMAADPRRCAECYNRAAAAVPNADLAPLLVRADSVEVPLWRIAPDGRRQPAFDEHVAAATTPSEIQNPKSQIDLLPRALLMTALARLGMCDLFIHGTGGMVYDRAMELWIKEWLGVETAPAVMVTATLRLPLLSPAESQPRLDPVQSLRRVRRLWHDPESDGQPSSPSGPKRHMLDQIQAAPRRSTQRRALFLAMHQNLAESRENCHETIQAVIENAERAKRQAAERAIADRRDWAFPLYPRQAIDELVRAVREAAGSAAIGAPASGSDSVHA